MLSCGSPVVITIRVLAVQHLCSIYFVQNGQDHFVLFILAPICESIATHEISQFMHPHTGIGGGEISIVDLHTGVVVPEFRIRNGHLDDRDESIMLTQTTLVEFIHIAEWYV